MTKSNRVRILQRVAIVLAVILGLRVLALILFEYQFYFPPNFAESNFLAGREETFNGLYRSAFYVHIFVGPFTIVVGTVLMFSGVRKKFKTGHRLLGRIQMSIVVAFLVPSGLVMATQSFPGPIAGWGFASLSIATATTAIMAVSHARKRRFVDHQLWATRCFILLCSPMLLRLMSGAMIVLSYESVVSYRFIAWLSWIIPLAIFEIWRFRIGRKRHMKKRRDTYTNGVPRTSTFSGGEDHG